VPAPPGDGERPRRSALDELPNRQRALLEQRGHGSSGQTARIISLVVLLVIVAWILVGLIGLVPAAR
jgi:hypothetical protein